MTDSAVDQSVKQDNDREISLASQNSVQLQFPQLLLEASLHSLLSHSYSSGSASTVINMTRTGQSLSESWASFSDADFSQEDDLRSETTDAGSLIDVNSSQDIHSVNEHGESSDGEEAEHSPLRSTTQRLEEGSQSEEEYDVVIKRSLAPALPSEQSTSENGDIADEISALLESSQHHYVRQSALRADDKDHVVGSTINMAVSESRLEFGRRPFRILYLGSNAVLPDTKVEVLRKIGAVLVAGASSLIDSACYHVIPSDFGSGSAPDTTELIPVPTQMIIHECRLPIRSRPLENDGAFELELIDGSSLRGNAERLEVQGADEHWYQPDLLLLLTSETDSAQHRQAAGDMLSLAQTYFLPRLVLRQETGWDSSYYLRLESDSLHEKVMVDSTDPDCGLKIAVGVNDFAALDSEQLSRHFKFIISTELEASRRSGPPSGSRSRNGVSRWLASLRPDEANSEKTKPNTQVPSLPTKHKSFSIKSYQWIRTCVVATVWVLVLAFFSSYAYEQALWMAGHRPNQSRESVLEPFRGVISTLPDRIDGVTTALESVSTRSAELSLISEKLREVAEYLPLHKVAENFVKDASPVDGQGKPKSAGTARLGEVKKLYIGDAIAVSDSFFRDGRSDFDIAITRNGHPISYILKEVGFRETLVTIGVHDLHGKLRLTLKSRGKQKHVVHAEVTVREETQQTAKGVRLRSLGSATTWPLVHVHTEDTGLRTGLNHVRLYALKTIVAAQSSIEDKLAEQTLACRQKSDKCWAQKAQQLPGKLSKAAQQYEQSIVETSQQAQEQARALADGVVDTVSNALDILRDLVPSTVRVTSKVRKSGERMSRRAAKKAAKAQKRAKKLLSQRCGRSWKRSRC